MKDNLSGGASERVPAEHPSTPEDQLLGCDRPAWAWEFLRRNPRYRAAVQRAPKSKRRTISGITVIEAAECAPEVRTFGMCFC